MSCSCHSFSRILRFAIGVDCSELGTTDSSGFVDPVELAEAIRDGRFGIVSTSCSVDTALALISLVDINGDGIMEYSAFIKALTRSSTNSPTPEVAATPTSVDLGENLVHENLSTEDGELNPDGQKKAIFFSSRLLSLSPAKPKTNGNSY